MGLVRVCYRRIELDFAQRPYFGQSHTVSRQNARIGMDQHFGHAQSVRHQTGVLPARAAKALQGVLGHIMAPLHADLLDRVGHVVDGDMQKAFGDILGPARGFAGRFGDLLGQRLKLFAHHVAVQWQVAIRAEHMGEVVGVQLAQHDVAIGDGQRPAPAIAGRTRISARAFRSHLKPPVAEGADRPAASGNRMNIHHRGTHPDACHLGLERPFVIARIVADIGRRAAHVKADQLAETGGLAGFDHADDPPRRTGQNRVFSLKQRRIRQPARGLHEQQPFTRAAHIQGARHLIDIAAQDGRKVGVNHGRIPPPDQLGEA